MNTIKITAINGETIDFIKKYIHESELLTIILKENEDTKELKLDFEINDLKLIYSYMKHSFLNSPRIENIEKPAVKPIEEYLEDDWYKDFFPKNLRNAQKLYNVADFLAMKKLCVVLLGYISYYLNNSEEEIESLILLPNKKNERKVYNIDDNTFIDMTEEEIKKYIENQSKKWKICVE